MSSDWVRTQSREADLLALKLARQDPRPVATFDEINSDFVAFQEIYSAFVTLLERDSKSLDLLDTLIDPPLSQTLDEYEDFVFDADQIRRGSVASFSKRELRIPFLPYKIARYVYTDTDIRQLRTKISWQTRIMNAKMDDMVLSYLTQVQWRSQAMSSRKPHHSELSSSNTAVVAAPDALNVVNDDETSIVSLWDHVNHLNNRLTQVSISPDSSLASVGFGPEDISNVMNALCARFQKTAGSESARPSKIWSIDQLGIHSENRLKSLLRDFPGSSFMTHKRVYYKGEVIDLRESFRSDSKTQTASIDILLPKTQFNLSTLDFIKVSSQTIIVGVDENQTFAALHYMPVPQHTLCYPTTNTRWIDAVNHDASVFLKEECFVQMTGSKNFSEAQAMIIYNFPQKSDCFAFQSAMRSKLLRHVFDVDQIESRHTVMTTDQNLKIWSNLDNKNYTLAFYVKKRTGYETYLEFPLDCFLPKTTPSHDKNKPHSIRLYFRLHRRDSPHSKRSSRESMATSFSPPRATKKEGGVSSPGDHLQSKKESTSKSILKVFSRNRDALKVPLSPPLSRGTTDERSNRSIGSTRSHSTENTPADSVVSTSLRRESKVHPDAENLEYLDFNFSSSSDAETFSAVFKTALIKPVYQGHFRGNSIFDGSLERSKTSPSEAITVGDVAKSPKPIYIGNENEPSHIGRPLPYTPLLSTSTEKDLGISFGDDRRVEDGSIAEQAFAFEDYQPTITKDSSSSTFVGSDIVYRIRGIPSHCQIELKAILASMLNIDSTEIDLKSLAMSPDGKSQTAIVAFDKIPSAISSGGNTWSFKWKFVEGKNASHVQIDTHFNRLTMLHTPARNFKHEIDICAVAIGDSPFGAFERKGKGGSYMWILELLQDYFTGARIMIYGCGASRSNTGSSSVVDSLAREFIENIKDLEVEEETGGSRSTYARARNVPLLLIGYSMAGLVIKQAMVLASEQSDDDYFFNSVYGALFFGVPSNALEPFALRTLFNDEAELFKEMSNQKVMDLLNENFNVIIKSKELHMQYFYESERTLQMKTYLQHSQRKSTTTLDFVVPPQSATNLVKSPRRVHSIQKDHVNLVKWGAHDPECEMVVRIMKTMKMKALAKQQNQARTVPSPEPTNMSTFQEPFRRPTGFSVSPRIGTGFQQASRTATGFTSTTQSETARASHPILTDDYHVGWICAIGREYVAALQLLDKRLTSPPDLPVDDENAYSFGIIGEHHVAIVSLAQGKYGLTSAASAATHMQRSFKFMRIGLMVGIAGGAPSKKNDIRLGDVVVSKPQGREGGVLRYDSGKKKQNEEFEIMGSLNSPPDILLKALTKLGGLHESDGHGIKLTVETMLEKNPRLRNKYQKPSLDTDVLYESSFVHLDKNQSCMESCYHHQDRIVQRPRRDIMADDPVVHFGLIASGDQLMKDASVRDALAEKEDVLCFEMEAAGLMGRLPCLIIRGICDYSDTHKNDLWQGYAAATAAAYARELLLLALSRRKVMEETNPTGWVHEDEDMYS